eukprot:scaffold17170_cov20-Prasinocladus_malaysianus.AAC.1
MTAKQAHLPLGATTASTVLSGVIFQLSELTDCSKPRRHGAESIRRGAGKARAKGAVAGARRNH